MIGFLIKRNVKKRGKVFNIVDLDSIGDHPLLMQEAMQTIAENGGVSKISSDYSCPFNLRGIKQVRKLPQEVYLHKGQIYSALTHTVLNKLQAVMGSNLSREPTVRISHRREFG